MVILLPTEFFHHHNYLNIDTEENSIYYFYDDYIPRGGYNAGSTNSLISNYKKSVDSHENVIYYKNQAIKKVAELIKADFNELKNEFTFIPIPPSKSKNDELYDDRNFKCLNLAIDCNVKDLLSFRESHEAFHVTGHRPSPAELRTKLELQKEEIKTKYIVLFDDFLTSGSHFIACKSILQEYYPNKEIYGLFIARRKKDEPFDDFDIAAFFEDLQ